MAELAQPAQAIETPVGNWSHRFSLRRLDVRGWSAVRRLILVLMVIYLAKQIVITLVFPPFTGHDEVAHYSYLRTVATEGRVPVLLEDRLPPELYKYCKFTLGWICFPTNQRLLAEPPYGWPYSDGITHPEGLQYAANHPPLYYLLMTPLYWLSDGASAETQVYLLRFAAIPFGLMTVLLAFLMSRTLFPGDAFMAVTVPAFVAFQTQVSYEAAMVNNDIVAIALYSALLYLLVVGLRDRFPSRLCVLIGFTLGLALLTKGTSITAAPIVAGAVIFGVGVRNWRGWIRRGVLIVAPTALLIAPWYVFLYRTYGNFSGLPQVEEAQWWDRPAGSFFELLFNRDFAAFRFAETWGYFGWRRIPLNDSLLWAIGLPLLAAAIGLVWYLITANPVRPLQRFGTDEVATPMRWQYLALLMLVGTCLIAYLAVVQFGTRFSLTQARYYFPAVNAAALLVLLGLRTFVPRSVRPFGQTAIVVALVLLNVVIYTQYVLPYYPYWYRS